MDYSVSTTPQFSPFLLPLVTPSELTIEQKIENSLVAVHFNTKKNNVGAKRHWYRLGKYLLNGNKLNMHPQSKVGARRTYRFYQVSKGDWNGPSSRQLSKMNKVSFELLLGQRITESQGTDFFPGGENLSGFNPSVRASHVDDAVTTGPVIATDDITWSDFLDLADL